MTEKHDHWAQFVIYSLIGLIAAGAGVAGWQNYLRNPVSQKPDEMVTERSSNQFDGTEASATPTEGSYKEREFIDSLDALKVKRAMRTGGGNSKAGAILVGKWIDWKMSVDGILDWSKDNYSVVTFGPLDEVYVRCKVSDGWRDYKDWSVFEVRGRVAEVWDDGTLWLEDASVEKLEH